MPYDILMPERKHIPIVCLVIPDSFSTRAGLVGDIIGERRGVAQSGRAPAWGVGGRRFESDHPDQKTKAVNEPIGANVNSFYVSRDTLKLDDVLSSFIYSSVHKSPKTIKTPHETLNPFIDYLYRNGVGHHLDITRQHVEAVSYTHLTLPTNREV